MLCNPVHIFSNKKPEIQTTIFGLTRFQILPRIDSTRIAIYFTLHNVRSMA